MSRSNTHPSEVDEENNQVTELFAIVNGEILEDLGENVTATYTRIHYLLRGLREFPDIMISTISFKQFNRKDPIAVIYNNAVKSLVAIRTIWALIKNRPLVYFAYPHSLTTVQNRFVFRLCEELNLRTVLDIHDTIEQSEAIGSGNPILDEELEGYYFRNATLILALNLPMWRYIQEKYKIADDRQVIFVPNAFEEEFCELYKDTYKSVPNRFNICYIGGLTKGRGIDILVRACESLHRRYPYLNLYLFGFYGKGISSELRNAIEGSDFIITKQVTRKNLPVALKDMDLFVMPYNPNIRYLNFSSPTKFFEYIGTGKPIVCTKCQSLLNFGERGEIIYFDYNSEDLESKIEHLIDNPLLRENISQKLMELRPEHTWKKRSEELYTAIRCL
jgi:glycosyltransferase involved in cell wall biosynthesis